MRVNLSHTACNSRVDLPVAARSPCLLRCEFSQGHTPKFSQAKVGWLVHQLQGCGDHAPNCPQIGGFAKHGGLQESFFGKLLLHITVFAILLFRSSEDVEKYKNLFDEATFYDKQWNATWEGQVRPSEKEKSQ